MMLRSGTYVNRGHPSYRKKPSASSSSSAESCGSVVIARDESVSPGSLGSVAENDENVAVKRYKRSSEHHQHHEHHEHHEHHQHHMEMTSLDAANEICLRFSHPLRDGRRPMPVSSECTLVKYFSSRCFGRRSRPHELGPGLALDVLVFGATYMQRWLSTKTVAFRGTWLPFFVQGGEWGAHLVFDVASRVCRVQSRDHAWMVVRYMVCISLANKMLGSRHSDCHVVVNHDAQLLMGIRVDPDVIETIEYEILDALDYRVMPLIAADSR